MQVYIQEAKWQQLIETEELEEDEQTRKRSQDMESEREVDKLLPTDLLSCIVLIEYLVSLWQICLLGK